MKKKSILAEWGYSAIGYLEPVPTFRPPSLPNKPVERTSKLLEKFMKRDEQRLKSFQHRYLLKQPKTVMPHVTTVLIDPSPIFHFFAESSKIKQPIRYNLLRTQSRTKGRRNAPNNRRVE